MRDLKMKEAREFSYIDVLAVIHKREYNDGVYQLLTYLTGARADYDNCLELMKICHRYLIDLFPKLNTILVQQAFIELDRRLETKDVLCTSITINRWLSENTEILTVYGENLEIKPLELQLKNKGKVTNFGLGQIKLIKKQYNW